MSPLVIRSHFPTLYASNEVHHLCLHRPNYVFTQYTDVSNDNECISAQVRQKDKESEESQCQHGQLGVLFSLDVLNMTPSDLIF